MAGALFKHSRSEPGSEPKPVSDSDSQALAAFGAACIDNSTATTGLHANEKTVGAGAAGLGGLVRAFHGVSLKIGVKSLVNHYPEAHSGKPEIIAGLRA
jgi:hypothetical protein